MLLTSQRLAVPASQRSVRSAEIGGANGMNERRSSAKLRKRRRRNAVGRSRTNRLLRCSISACAASAPKREKRADAAIKTERTCRAARTILGGNFQAGNCDD